LLLVLDGSSLALFGLCSEQCLYGFVESF
jgi:hypothetical protein